MGQVSRATRDVDVSLEDVTLHKCHATNTFLLNQLFTTAVFRHTYSQRVARMSFDCVFFFFPSY